MSILYNDINTQKLEYLLEATPFSADTSKTFSGKLTENMFFDKIYVPSYRKGLTQQNQAEIVNFESGINSIIRQFGNEHERVTLVHIKGYGGCGKTTYVHYLLTKIKKSTGGACHGKRNRGSSISATTAISDFSLWHLY